MNVHFDPETQTYSGTIRVNDTSVNLQERIYTTRVGWHPPDDETKKQKAHAEAQSRLVTTLEREALRASRWFKDSSAIITVFSDGEMVMRIGG